MCDVPTADAVSGNAVMSCVPLAHGGSLTVTGLGMTVRPLSAMRVATAADTTSSSLSAGSTADVTVGVGEGVGVGVAGIGGISETIARVNEIATVIASAMEEQGAATSENGRNVQEAAQGTQEVNTNITGVSQAVTETGAAANQVLSAAGELANQSDLLGREVQKFLDQIRAA